MWKMLFRRIHREHTHTTALLIREDYKPIFSKSTRQRLLFMQFETVFFALHVNANVRFESQFTRSDPIFSEYRLMALLYYYIKRK